MRGNRTLLISLEACNFFFFFLDTVVQVLKHTFPPLAVATDTNRVGVSPPEDEGR